ncbi:hypothetical protein RF11_05611 [Thelohanellus kitauei]|uniref:Uncharacterized protein n=1 Tax=Thelohanellus kitauei TaxID=669202 RepID=A0A0C2IUL9_THEKT|nr:hypothetical protein RF11_05611 [Thelohanellus kitauei]
MEHYPLPYNLQKFFLPSKTKNFPETFLIKFENWVAFGILKFHYSVVRQVALSTRIFHPRGQTVRGAVTPTDDRLHLLTILIYNPVSSMKYILLRWTQNGKFITQNSKMEDKRSIK